MAELTRRPADSGWLGRAPSAALVTLTDGELERLVTEPVAISASPVVQVAGPELPADGAVAPGLEDAVEP